MAQNDYQLSGRLSAENRFLLSPGLLSFLVHMERFARPKRQQILHAREIRQQQFDAGHFPHFLEETAAIRAHDWTINHTPEDLVDRRVEITGPVDRKMIINALNSGAKVFMADFEDSNSPTWDNCLNGQKNLFDAVRKDVRYEDPHSGKLYQLKNHTAVLMVRPRGWHLDEVHLQVDDAPISASLFDALIFLHHNAEELRAQGTGAYFYLPKLESHHEAKLWQEVFTEALDYLQLPKDCVKITVLIETITAAFEMDEIIYELRDYIVGLNCGRWDYIFSYIKKFRNHADFLLPDRQQVTMTSPFLNAYVHLLIHTCHRRGIHAMGGMAAQIPIKGDEAANNAAMERVLADKKREVLAGHDGTWVAHPGLIPLAMDVFNQYMPEPNQIHKGLEENSISAKDLLEVPKGDISEQGVRNNITVALLYLEAWLKGNGCVPIRHLMEDAATAEICRAQLWQWHHFSASLSDGRSLSTTLLQHWVDEELATLLAQPEYKHSPTLQQAKKLLEEMVFSDKFDEFLTIKAYPCLLYITQEEG